MHSWTASVRLAAEERRAHALTASYAMQLRERAEGALNDERQVLATAARSAGDRARARSATDSLEQAIHLLAEATP